MIHTEGYLTAVGVGLLDVGESIADENVKTKVGGVDTPLADQTLNILNVGRLVEAVGTNVGAYWIRNKTETPVKRVVEAAAIATIPLAVRTIVNIVRREVITPHMAGMRGRGEGHFQTEETNQMQTITSGGRRRFSGFT